ncbi:SGNH/GDSL hydrolase family protein [Candidatus Omnitrophota bacterium]
MPPHPYLIYYPTPGYSNELTFHNSLGYRGGEFDLKKKAGSYRIVTLGGSTTYTSGVSDNNKIFTTYLEAILGDAYGYNNVEVINAGVGGYNTWTSLVNLEFRVLELDPDLIIICHGINDVGIRISRPELYRSDNTGIFKQWEIPEQLFYERSVFLRSLVRKVGYLSDSRKLQRVFGLRNLTKFTAPVRYGEPKLTPAEKLKCNKPIYFERNLRNMIAIAKDHGIDIMLGTLLILETLMIVLQSLFLRKALMNMLRSLKY